MAKEVSVTSASKFIGLVENSFMQTIEELLPYHYPELRILISHIRDMIKGYATKEMPSDIPEAFWEMKEEKYKQEIKDGLKYILDGYEYYNQGNQESGYKQKCLQWCELRLNNITEQQETIEQLSKLGIDSKEYEQQLQELADTDFQQLENTAQKSLENQVKKDNWLQQQKDKYQYGVRIFNNNTELELAKVDKNSTRYQELLAERAKLGTDCVALITRITNQERDNVQEYETQQKVSRRAQEPIEVHKLVKKELLTSEQAEILGYEICDTFLQYNVEWAEPNMKRLFKIAKNYNPLKPNEGFHKLKDNIGYQKIAYVIKEGIIKLLEERQLNFDDLEHIEGLELEKLEKVKIREGYQFLDYIIENGLAKTFKKRVKEQNILTGLNLSHKDLELIGIILAKDEEALKERAAAGDKLSQQASQLIVNLYFKDRKTAINVKQTLPLIEVSPGVNGTDHMIHIAAREGDIETLTTLLQQGINIELQDEKGATPLHLALDQSHDEVADILLAKQVNLNIQDKRGYTCLFTATNRENFAMVLKLLAKEADPNITNDEECIPLHYAATRGNTELAELLVAYKSNVQAKDATGETPLHLASKKGSKKLCELLIAKGAAVNAQDNKKRVPLHWAANGENVEAISTLIAYGAAVNAQTETGLTPLHTAVDAGKVEAVSILINHGAAVNEQDNEWWTPLHIAVYRRNIEIVSTLIKHGAKKNILNKDNSTALHTAVNTGQANMIDLLYNDKTELELKCKGGYTLLNLAVYKGYTDIVDNLYNKGANLNSQNDTGATPLSVAVHKHNIAIIEALLKYGADPNIANSNKSTPSHLAVYNKDWQIAKTLIAHGAEYTVKNSSDKTTLDYIIEENQEEVLIQGIIEYSNKKTTTEDRIYTITNQMLKLKEAQYNSSPEKQSAIKSICEKLEQERKKQLNKPFIFDKDSKLYKMCMGQPAEGINQLINLSSQPSTSKQVDFNKSSVDNLQLIDFFKSTPVELWDKIFEISQEEEKNKMHEVPSSFLNSTGNFLFKLRNSHTTNDNKQLQEAAKEIYDVTVTVKSYASSLRRTIIKRRAIKEDNNESSSPKQIKKTINLIGR